MGEPLQFGVLGPLTLFDATARAPLTAPALRSLLTQLLLAEGPVMARQIREVLDDRRRWADPAGPAHVAVHRLRTWLRRSCGYPLDLEPGGYRLIVPPGIVDAGLFRALVTEARQLPDGPERADRLLRALRLWRGPVAADAPDRVRQQHQARQLERLRREATIELTATSLRVGRAEQALPLLEPIADDSPYDEQLQSLLALTLAGCGLQGEGLAVIARTRRALATDLGIDPGRHLRDAQNRILQHRRVAPIAG